MSIPLNFGLFWAGAKMSYLRYLTFKTLRHHHPKSKIQLYVSEKFDNKIHKWAEEKQDFESQSSQIDYVDRLSDIGVDVIRVESIGSSDICPILQADLFRWMWMKENGGFYLDTDQIILRPFDTLPLDNEFIYCRYMEPQCGDYLPTGVLGMEKDSKISDIVIPIVVSAYNSNNYNSSGPFMMRQAIRKINLSRGFNAKHECFYPIFSSSEVWRIYSGKVAIGQESFALHWFGGHPLSQGFNGKYTEEMAKNSKDTISVLVRNMGLI